VVSVSASVNLPLHHKVQKFSSGIGSRGWSRKKGRKMVVLVVVLSNCKDVKRGDILSTSVLNLSVVITDHVWYVFTARAMLALQALY